MIEPNTIALLAGTLFLLIAIVGGGFIIKEIQIPKVPTWARIISGFLGLIFCFLYFYNIPPAVNEEHTIHSEKESDMTVPNLKPSSSIENQIIYIDTEPDITIHNIKLIEVSAKSIHNPPQVNDMITIEFKIQNVSNRPIILNRDVGTFVAARNPSYENEDFGYSNQNKTIQPQENIKTKAHKIVDAPGIWQFGPCYVLDMIAVSEKEENICPSEWRRFPVRVVP